MFVGALAGTSPVTSYIESAPAWPRGPHRAHQRGRGTAVPGDLVFAPVVQAIPAAATAPALILVAR